MIKLYSYWRSSAAYRVRIGLHLKGIEHEIVPVNMLKDGGEQHGDKYRQLNPQGLVPTLIDGQHTITQSLAILEYLEEKYPQTPLLPDDIACRAEARQLAQLIACDIHPLNNLRVMQYLKHDLQVSDEVKDRWYENWIALGFEAFETRLSGIDHEGPYCLGENITLADLCLVPQMYNARRFDIPLDNYTALCAIEQACLKLESFIQAAPENQIDASGS